MIGSHGNLILKFGVDSPVGVCLFIRQCRLFHRFYRPNNQTLFSRMRGAVFFSLNMITSHVAVVGPYQGLT